MPFDNLHDLFTLSADTAALVNAIRRDKYMQSNEREWNQTLGRVALSLLQGTEVDVLHDAMLHKVACPAGRVMAGAGTDKNVTWVNCFIAPLLQDSIKTDPTKPGLGIMDCLSNVAYSMQMGGGVGTDFSPLRPENSLVKRLMASASGPLSFMNTWDAMCRTIMSAGDRRGAMMATLRCDHPDIVKFITAKHDPAALRMFNVSVLITDDFMQAKDNDGMWALGHWEPPFDESKIKGTQTRYHKGDERTAIWYVYEYIPARKLWEMIMDSTYTYAEPGVIFIDRINKLHNLYYYENVNCTNPCGEEPMAHNDNCNLSHLNLSRCTTATVDTIFTSHCFWDGAKIDQTARILTRMGDNVIDLTPWPTELQKIEAFKRRRIGIGFTGLANALMFRGIRYGSPEAQESAADVMQLIRNSCYRESIELAREKGPFPAFDRDKYLSGKFIKTMPEDILDGISQYGIRNALLNTIAPTGTISIASADNASGGIEPVFDPVYMRKVLQADNSFKSYRAEDFGFRVYANAGYDGDFDAMMADKKNWPDFMVTVPDLKPDDHLYMQAAVQQYVDSSISKTINCPEDLPFNEFANIYTKAYELGCKGCTTYRPVPASGRGSVLSAIEAEKQQPEWTGMFKPAPLYEMTKRPRKLPGETYKLEWGEDSALYLTFNDRIEDGKSIPYEFFINTKSPTHHDYQQALARMISAVMRKGGDVRFIAKELSEIHSKTGGEWIDGTYVPSVISLMGITMMDHFREIGYIERDEWLEVSKTDSEIIKTTERVVTGSECPSCRQLTLIRQEGCWQCTNCTYNKCG